MKFKSLLKLGAIFLLTLFFACQKSQTSENSRPKPLFQKNGATGESGWHIRRGTHLHNDCKFNLPCGPCAGICVEFAIVVDTSNVTPSEDLNGDVLVYATLIDSSHLKLSFTTPITNGVETSPGYTEISSNYNIGANAANSLGKSNISIIQGNYPIDYSNNANGDVVFDISSN